MINPFTNPAYMLPPLVALFVSFALIVIVVTWGRRGSVSWVFSALLFSVGIWGFLLFGMRSSPDVELAVIWGRIASVPAVATFVLFYHFTIAYTQVRNQKRYLLAAYLVLIIIAILSPTGLMIREIRIEDYGYAPVQGPLSIAVSIITLPLLAGGIYNLVRSYRLSASYEERNRIIYLLIAISFPVIGALLDSLTNLPPMLVWGQVIFVLICSVAIVRYHMLDIRIVFRKGLAYLLLSTIVAVPYVVILVLLNRFAKLNASSWWIHVLTIFVLSIALQPLYNRAQQIVDRFFYRDRYDHLMALEKLSRETQSVLNINELSSKLMQSLAGALQISSGCLLLKTDDNMRFTVNHCIESPDSPPDVVFKKDSIFINWLETHIKPVYSKDFSIVPLLQSLTAEEKRSIEMINARLWVPISPHPGELSGILALGEKISQRPYSVEDGQLISTIANHMAISLENARLYYSEKSMREMLQKIDEQKTQFLHGVAHELRTPLTAIMSSSEILDEEVPQSEEVRQRLYGNIKRSSHIMNRRVADLLELARTQIGEIKINPAPLDMVELISESTSQMTVLFQNKSQALNIEIPDFLPEVKADRDKLQQVLFNLLSNANKYSPYDCRIELRAREDDGKVWVEVIDSAPRISEENRERIFNPYYRIEENYANDEAPGLGLGLAIAKNIVQMHRGEIWVEDNQPEGNKFVFTLPSES